MAGRPTLYREEYCIQAEKLCKLGATDAELADFFEVDESTITNWKSNYPEFFASIKSGKIIADAEVASRLYKRATGYEFRETTFEKVGLKQETIEVGEEGMESIENDTFKKKVVVKEMPPDTTATIFWLKNRQPKKWRDKQEVDLRTPEGITVLYQLQPGNAPLDESSDEGNAGIPGEQASV